MARLPTIDNRAAISRSVQDVRKPYTNSVHILQIANAADEAPPWWSPNRDVYLDKFWPTEPYLSGAIYSVASRNASFRYELNGSERDVWWSQRLLTNANFGQGWQNFVMKITLDVLCQGNGGFFEVIRPARTKLQGKLYNAIKMHDDNGNGVWVPFDPDTGEVFYKAAAEYEIKALDNPLDLPIGIAHLDAQRCQRTGDPLYPVIYTDIYGKKHKLRHYQVVTLEEMPSPREDMHDVGHCSVDRCLRLAQILRDMLIYKHEKVSGRFTRAIHITNADAQMVQDAIDQSEASNDSRGLMRYSQPVVLSTVDPTAVPQVATIPLATLPDGFNEEDTMRWYIAGVANAFGVDYGFLAPLPGNKLGTSTQAETQERQARGKSSRLFMQIITHKFNYSGILPRTVRFQFAVADPWEESEQDRALARRARAYQTMIQSGLLPIEIVRQIAADKGDLDPKYLQMMGEADMTPEITVGSTDVRRVMRQRKPVVDPEQLTFWEPPQQANGNGNGKGGEKK